MLIQNFFHLFVQNFIELTDMLQMFTKNYVLLLMVTSTSSNNNLSEYTWVSYKGVIHKNL
jgi:hypothetical protein